MTNGETIGRPRIERVVTALWPNLTHIYPFQWEALRGILTGHDVLTLAATGSGKSLTYQVAALIRPGCTLVVSPLVALIRDQVTTLHDKGLTMVGSLISGMSAAEQEEVLRDVREGRITLLYLAPERLRDPRFRLAIEGLPIVQLVVDEAHCIATWGHDFRPDFLEVARLLPRGAARTPIHALTATATPAVQSEIVRALHFDETTAVRNIKAEGRDNLSYRVYTYTNTAEGEARAVELVEQIVHNRERGGAGIVYVARRATAERLADLLRTRNVAAQAYHGGLQSTDRHMIQELFMDGTLEVVCCTNAFGMGIDKSNIRFVLHYDHPSSLEAYAQETGRAGRDHEPAYAILLYSPATARTHRGIARKGTFEANAVEELLNTLGSDAVQTLADGLVVTTFERVAQAMAQDEVLTRVLMHGAAQVGLVERGEDVVMSATLLVSMSHDTLLYAVAAADRSIAAKLLDHIELPQTSAPRHGVRLTYDALKWMAAGGDPFVATRLLTALGEAFPDDVIFRPFTRGLSVRILPYDARQRLEAIRQLENALGERYAAFETRLGVMRNYATQSYGCRQAFIENYLLGSNTSAVCGKCDVCAPNHPLAWDDRRTDANVAAYMKRGAEMPDVALPILEALRDHNGYFGQSTIVKMLLGQAVTQYKDGTKHQLPPSARNSEHFGVLQRQRAKDMAVKARIEALQHDGFIASVTRTRPDGGDYSALTLTARGRDALSGALGLTETAND